MEDRDGVDLWELLWELLPDQPEPTRTEAAPNVVRLTPREGASLRAFVHWQLPEAPEPEQGEA